MTHGSTKEKISEVVDTIALAGGEIVGRTRLQKIMYLLKITGLGADSFSFRYKHYGPFSDHLAEVTEYAGLFDSIEEETRRSTWGGSYYVYKTAAQSSSDEAGVKKQLIDIASKANPIDLELAATVAYLKVGGFDDPWQETRARKPDKVNRIESAKLLYERLSQLETPNRVPDVNGMYA
ncbi:hypothetical protein [Sediminimonas sp.]|uniref:hypothetical protein n=1 Tax=Sediminimonas sp. TaxID=2823379 RepID=UPI00286FCCFB|nr:hypothetical protein [Sediminimonas sp.]